jgi:hydrogenase maturation protease
MDAAGIWEKMALRLGEKLLIYGIGNRGRQDDGLAIRLIERLEDAPLPADVTLEAGYQLNIEDALLISRFDVVLFVDATAEREAAAPFALRCVEPSAEISFSTHAMHPQAVLALCAELYDRCPRAYLLALPGYEWEISEALSAPARHNLEQTYLAFVQARHA